MARARKVEVDCEAPFGLAAARVVEWRAEEVFAHAAGVLDLEDVERVHDMRVATRRLRAALEIFEPCFPPEQFGQALRDVKRLADALGERRDRDVAIAALNAFNDQMPAPDRRGVGSLIGELRVEQEEANANLAPLVDEQNLAALGESMEGLVAGARTG